MIYTQARFEHHDSAQVCIHVCSPQHIAEKHGSSTHHSVPRRHPQDLPGDDSLLDGHLCTQDRVDSAAAPAAAAAASASAATPLPRARGQGEDVSVGVVQALRDVAEGGQRLADGVQLLVLVLVLRGLGGRGGTGALGRSCASARHLPQHTDNTHTYSHTHAQHNNEEVL